MNSIHRCHIALALLAGSIPSTAALASASCDAVTQFGQAGFVVQTDEFQPNMSGIGGSFAAGEIITVSSQTDTLAPDAAVLMDDVDAGYAAVLTLAAPGSRSYAVTAQTTTHHFFITNQGISPATVVWTCSAAGDMIFANGFDQ